MISFTGEPVLVVAALVWVVWRGVLWRRRRPDLVRELAVAALFAWSLVIVYYTFFPLVIIFYDWHSRVSLVPFASILQLLRETTPALAVRNIVGNLLLFLPLGTLLPLLFPRLRSGRALLWRLAAVSAAIELLQLATRARAIDVDDIILNTTGGMVGWGVFLVAEHLVRRARAGRALLDRAGTTPTDREPLLTGAVPVLVTIVLTVPVMVTMLVSQTLSDDAMVADALAGWDEVVARVDAPSDTFLVLAGDVDGRLGFAGYERVLPGRYTPQSRDETTIAEGSAYLRGVTAFNPSKGERPTVTIWGLNRAGAASIEVRGNGLDVSAPLPATPAFVVAFSFDAPDAGDMLGEFEVTFLDATGADVSDEIPHIFD